MILVDTSVWIDHLRSGDARLAKILEDGRVLTHSFVVGELACGNLKNRREILALLDRLPRAPIATDAEARLFIERHSLMGRDLGYVDVHLLASAALASPASLWTRDRQLATAASELGIGSGH